MHGIGEPRDLAFNYGSYALYPGLGTSEVRQHYLPHLPLALNS
jgi:hypothetical protein